MKGKYVQIEPGALEVIVQYAEPSGLDWRNDILDQYPTDPLRFKRGSYRRSNVKLKNGTWVFEWMGFYG